jgi:hypothetical protein
MTAQFKQANFAGVRGNVTGRARRHPCHTSGANPPMPEAAFWPVTWSVLSLGRGLRQDRRAHRAAEGVTCASTRVYVVALTGSERALAVRAVERYEPLKPCEK